MRSSHNVSKVQRPCERAQLIASILVAMSDSVGYHGVVWFTQWLIKDSTEVLREKLAFLRHRGHV